MTDIGLSQSVLAEAVRLLNGLTRKGAHLEPSHDAFVLVVPGGRVCKTASARLIAPETVHAAAAQGWIAQTGNIYRLTEAGALALRTGAGPAPQRVLPQMAQPPKAPTRHPAEIRRVEGNRRPATQPSHQMEAAERLAEDFLTGQMSARITSNWDRVALGALPDGARHPSGRGLELSDRVSSAQERVRRALADAGPEFADPLIDLVCFETGIEDYERKRGWPRRSAKLVLGLALDRLARHYGIVGRGPQTAPTRHWGASGYRPA
jgi:hypothetical protein